MIYFSIPQLLRIGVFFTRIFFLYIYLFYSFFALPFVALPEHLTIHVEFIMWPSLNPSNISSSQKPTHMLAHVKSPFPFSFFFFTFWVDCWSLELKMKNSIYVNLHGFNLCICVIIAFCVNTYGLCISSLVLVGWTA